MGHLDELYARYRERGLVVLAVTDENSSLVEKFVADTSATHPIVIEKSDSSREYGIDGFPTSFLIGPDGRIAWTGHPGNLKDEDVERLLQDVRLVPKLPRALSGAAKDLEKGDYAGARKFLQGKMETGRLEEEDRVAAEELIRWIDGRGADLAASAKADIGKGDFYEASQTLEKLSEGFKGLEVGDRAKEDLDGLRKDRESKREIDAGRTLESVRERARKMKPEQVAEAFRAVARKFEGTKAAAKATDLAVRAEAEARKR